MSNIRDIPHIQQKNRFANGYCGAACLQMMFREWGIDVSQEEIWKNISMKRNDGVDRFCSTNLMLKYAESLGFNSMGISVNNVSDVLDYCQKQKIEVIFIRHISKNDLSAHFNLFLQMNDSSVYVNDPQFNEQKGSKAKLSLLELKKLMQKQFKDDEILHDNIMLLFLPPNKQIDVCTLQCERCGKNILIINDVQLLVSHVFCTGHSNWVEIEVDKKLLAP